MTLSPLLTLALSLATAEAAPAPAAVAPASAQFVELEPGLELASFEAPQRSDLGDSLVRVLRIDPRRFELVLLNASARGEARLRNARGWATQHDLVAAINASMYATDYLTSVSLMRSAAHTNNPKLSRDRSVLAFDRKDRSVPPVQIIDRECRDYAELSSHYMSLVQSIRMISACDGRNVWKQQAGKQWSTAAIGVDRRGRVLFIHVRSPYTTHDVIDFLLELPLEIASAMYTEGSAPAQLYVNAGDTDLELAGLPRGLPLAEAGTPPPIPNVVGVRRRSR